MVSFVRFVISGLSQTPSLQWLALNALRHLLAVLWADYDFRMPSRWLRLSLAADTFNTVSLFLYATCADTGATDCQVSLG